MGNLSSKPTRVNFQISKPTWVICVIAIFTGLVCYWFFTNFTREPFTRELGYSQEARRNQFLAAQKFLEANQIRFQQQKDYTLFDTVSDSATNQEIGEPPILSSNDTVLINSSRVGMSTSRRQKMLDWVKQGGHLVLLATEKYDYQLESSRDKFLDELGLRFYDLEQDYSYQEESDPDDYLTQLTFEGFQQPTKVAFDAYGYINDASGNANFVAGPNTDADTIVQYHLEEGLVTVLVDFDIWNNAYIQQHDHAMLLLQLIGGSSTTWLIYNRNQPTLTSMALQHTPYIVISSALLLLLILYSNLWRRGPQRQDVAPVQREIIQHIAAAAEFNYQTDRGDALLKVMRESVEHRMKQLVHGFMRLTPAKQIEKIAQHSGLDKNQLIVLWQTDHQTNETFVTQTKLVQQLRKHL